MRYDVKGYMNSKDIVAQYMDIVFCGANLDALKDILHPQLEFRGPLYHFHSAEEYIASMKAAPPEGFSYELIKRYEDADSTCLLYTFSKPGLSFPIAQHFTIKGNLITEILLVFDSAPLAAP